MENEVLSRLGRPPMDRDHYRSTWGRPLFEALPERSPGVDVHAYKIIYAQLIKEYTDTGKLDVIPQANISALEQLSNAHKSLLLLTSRTHTELAHILIPTHVLSDRITAFYYKDNMQYHKPDPRAFEQIERQHGWRPEECVYVGDSISDAKAAKGAGLYFIASLESGLRRKEDFDAYKVDAFIHTFPELVSVIDSLEGQHAG